MKQPELSFRSGNTRKPLSAWMLFFLNLGRWLVEVKEPGARLVIGVSVPTRAYGAVLAAAGAVIGEAEREGGSADSAEAHFNYLASLPDGTSVTWHTPNAKKKVGWLAGVRDLSGKRVLMIQTSMRGGLLESCNLRDCLGVQPIGLDVPLPKGNVHAKPVGPTVPFLATLVPSSNLFRLVSQSSVDCLILGVKRWLVDEARQGELCVEIPSKGRLVTGTIGSILRLKDPHKPSDTYRTLAAPEAPSVKATPAAVIFDGAHPYIRSRHAWRHQPTLLILDRSDPRAGEGAHIMNEEYITKRISGWDMPEIDIPDGVELTAYLVEEAT